MKIVFIDLDGTLITQRNSEFIFGLELLLKGVLKKDQITAFLKFFYHRFSDFGLIVAKKNKAYLCGLEEKKISFLAEQYVQRRIRRLFRSQLIERIKIHRISFHNLFLLTGTLDCIANPIAKELGINHVHATRCKIENNHYTDAPPLIHPYGEEKLRFAQSIAKRFNTSLSNCIAYADSIADLPLLLAVSHPIVVSPDRKLSKIAIQKNWEILK